MRRTETIELTSEWSDTPTIMAARKAFVGVYQTAGSSGCTVVLSDGSKHSVWDQYDKVKKFIQGGNPMPCGGPKGKPKPKPKPKGK
jgi:hypothetical protein